MAKPNLRIVEPLALAQPGMKAIPPERRLPALFSKRDRIVRELALVDLDIAQQRVRYARNHGLLMLPSIDTLRRQFGGPR